MFGDRELTCSANWRNRARRFGEIVLGDLEESCLAIWRNHARRFGVFVLGDLNVLVERIGGHRGVAYISITVVGAYDKGEKKRKM